MKEINKKTAIEKIIKKDPKIAEILLEKGMSCIFCPMARNETLEQGCLAHGMNKKEIDKLVEEINKKTKNET